MKQVIKKLWLTEQTHDQFHMGSTIFMILLFLIFWAASFYILITNM